MRIRLQSARLLAAMHYATKSDTQQFVSLTLVLGSRAVPHAHTEASFSRRTDYAAKATFMM
jgi:hypothetical protein